MIKFQHHQPAQKCHMMSSYLSGIVESRCYERRRACRVNRWSEAHDPATPTMDQKWISTLNFEKLEQVRVVCIGPDLKIVA